MSQLSKNKESSPKMTLPRQILPIFSSALLISILNIPALLAQAPIIPINTIIANNGTVSTGAVTFSEFKKVRYIPTPFAVENLNVGDFADIGVSATANADGTVSLVLTAIDPVSGLPAPLGGEFFRPITYRVTVNNPALRLHSVNQAFDAGAVATGNMLMVNAIYAVDLIPNSYGGLMQDTLQFGGATSRGASRPSADGTPGNTGSGGIRLPGGNLPTYTMASEFYGVVGRFGLPSSSNLNSINVAFTLVPTGSPVPTEVVNLGQPGDVGLFGRNFIANGFFADSATGFGVMTLTNYAQDGGAVVSLSSSNPALVPVPPTVTVPQGYWVAPFLAGPANSDVPVPVTLTASYNGRIQTQSFTANPATPLTLTSVYAQAQQGFIAANTFRIWVGLSRVNVSPATVQLTSSDPALIPVPASITIPALSLPGDINTSTVLVTGTSAVVATPVTLTATLNGQTVTSTITVPKTVDTVIITKAELVVKSGQLKVDALCSSRTSILTLYNDATGQVIGTMTFSGTNGLGGKFSFQGTVAPVTTLLLKTSVNGSTRSGISLK